MSFLGTRGARSRTLAAIVALLVAVSAVETAARDDAGKALPGLDAPLVWNWRVQDAGNVHSLTTNMGQVGSQPGSTLPYSSLPSAEWPAGSGVEYLFSGGLWLGAVLGGEPHVTTAAYQVEFRPGRSDIDVIYETHAGAPGGNRVPSPDADDDHDGLLDEDRPDGRDNDGDARIDEDFAAISDQMLSSEYNDTDPAIQMALPNHVPLGLQVQQTSFAWTRSDLDDLIGFRYRITNAGGETLESVHVGFFSDCDIGLRSNGLRSEDDRAGFWEGTVHTTLEGSPADVGLSLGYMYDGDGDGGAAPGYIGFVFLGASNPDGTGVPVRLRNFRMFTGAVAFAAGGDPTNDGERFQCLNGSAPRSLAPPEGDPRPPVVASKNEDWRMVVSLGPLGTLAPGQSVLVSMAMVLGAGLDDLLQNAARARLLYDGVDVDCDGNPETPEICRVHWTTAATVPVLVEGFEAHRTADAAQLGWTVAPAALRELRGVNVQRAEAATGPYATRNLQPLAPAAAMSFVDPQVRADRPLCYRLELLMADGTRSFAGPVQLESGPDAWRTVLEPPQQHDAGTIAVRYSLAARADVRLAAYDVRGRLQHVLQQGRRDPGSYVCMWDGRDARGARLRRGVYILRLEAGGVTSARKLVLASD